MNETPVIHADIGDGKRRRFFLGADELRQMKREAGRGWFSIYSNFERDVEPDEVAAVLRLALIGGGESPKDASEIVGYYAFPPRPLEDAYMLAYRCLHACWAGADKSADGGQKLTTKEIDEFFSVLEAQLLKGGKDLSVLRNRSFGELQDIFAALKNAEDGPAAPDAETFKAIRELHKGGKK